MTLRSAPSSYPRETLQKHSMYDRKAAEIPGSAKRRGTGWYSTWRQSVGGGLHRKAKSSTEQREREWKVGSKLSAYFGHGSSRRPSGLCWVLLHQTNHNPPGCLPGRHGRNSQFSIFDKKMLTSHTYILARLPTSGKIKFEDGKRGNRCRKWEIFIIAFSFSSQGPIMTIKRKSIVRGVFFQF